jgi:cytochrome c biogenesis protein CcdA/glutathione peroxidase-family protein
MQGFEVGLAFLEGMALIASPCILPVLPLVLSTSLEGGKLRPFGIILGFVISFSIFALASATLVKSLGINLDIIKQGSLIILVLFAIVMMSNTLSEKFAQFTQKLSNVNALVKNQAGFVSGILIGCVIGVVWTPCAGPILAAALVQIIRQQTTLNSAIMVIAFSLGAGIPMLIIALMGRKIMTQLQFFAQHASLIRKILGALILLSVAFIASGTDLQSLLPQKNANIEAPAEQLIHPLGLAYPAPNFSGIQEWLNTAPLSMASLKGKVVLIDFWTYSCINCLRTLPYLKSWDQKYRDQGLVIVGVHAPEFEFEKNVANVKAAVAKLGIQYPVALDNQLQTWTNFHNLYWPAHYLIDRQGKVVYTHFGEGAYNITEHNIRALLNLKTDGELTPDTSAGYEFNQTPETYLGYLRMMNFANKGALARNIEKEYQFPADLPLHYWALQGKWTIEAEQIVATAQNAALRLHFKAKKVFLVMGNRTDKPILVNVVLNNRPISNKAGADAPNGTVVVKQHTLYELVSQEGNDEGLLEIKSDEPGLEAYAFTFGS